MSITPIAERYDIIELSEALNIPPASFAGDCHGVSLAVVRSGLYADEFPEARVARGFCDGVGGQHSWVALTGDCYDSEGLILDPTLCTYRDDVDDLWFGTISHGWHRPHGYGTGLSILRWGRPPEAVDTPVELTPTEPLSDFAQAFLGLLGPLDYHGWATLMNQAPVYGWPASEITAAAADTEALAASVPIDRLGMLTDRNPQGLYR